MLTALHIENIAIIDRLDAEFDSGLNVLTGETGAGKSIIIDSILLLLGGKSSKDLIRTGTDAAVVSACFCMLNDEAVQILTENGLQPDDDGNITIYRKIGRDGKNNARINGLNVTVSLLRELGAQLINVHGQHDGVLLLDSRRHLSYLDSFGRLDTELEQYQDCYQRVRALRDRLSALQQREAAKTQRQAQLTAYLEQLNSCALRAGEYEELRNKRSRLMQTGEIIENLSVATTSVYDGEPSAALLARQALDSLLPLEKLLPQGAELIKRMTQLSAELDDIGMELGKLFDEYKSEYMDPDEIEERLDELEEIKKQFGPSDQEVLRNQEAFTAELTALDQGAEELEQLNLAFAEARAELEQRAAALTAERKKYAAEMERRLKEELCYLDMPNVRFAVQIRDRINDRGGIRYRADGKDDVAFFLAANSGEDLKPLEKIASGGELSRIMLSIKSVLNQDFDTIIYDEIDTGVSGATAEKIGKKLQKSAQGRQVFCVTHLAQIAARGDHHFKISKDDRDGRVYSALIKLDTPARVREIARIMGGEELTETLLQSAEELLFKTS